MMHAILNCSGKPWPRLNFMAPKIFPINIFNGFVFSKGAIDPSVALLAHYTFFSMKMR